MGVDYYTCLVCDESRNENYISRFLVYQNKDDYAERNNSYVEIDHVCFSCIGDYTGKEPQFDENKEVYVLLIKKGKPLNITHTKLKH